MFLVAAETHTQSGQRKEKSSYKAGTGFIHQLSEEVRAI